MSLTASRLGFPFITDTQYRRIQLRLRRGHEPHGDGCARDKSWQSDCITRLPFCIKVWIAWRWPSLESVKLWAA